MKTRRILGVATVALLALGMAGCSGGDSGEQSGETGGSETSEPKEVSMLMNWFAQAEQGGYWAAKAEGIAEEHGIDLVIEQGGPGIQTNPMIASGEADFGVGNADEIIQASAEGLPLVAVAAGFQHGLQGFVYHNSSEIEGFEDFKGHTVSRMTLPYWDYISTTFDLAGNVEEVNVQSLSTFMSDENMVLQVYVTSEPFVLEQEGYTDFGVLSVAEDGGYDPYQNILYTTQSYLDENPETVQAVVDSVVAGWEAMLADPTATKAEIIEANPDSDEFVLDRAIELMQTDDSYLGTEIGSMSAERWEDLKGKLVEIGLVDADFDVTKAYTTEYSNR